jgi:hypothetical protein
MKHLFFSFSLILSGLSFAQVTETATPAPKVGLKFTTLEIVRENIPYDNKDLFEFEEDKTIMNQMIEELLNQNKDEKRRL